MRSSAFPTTPFYVVRCARGHSLPDSSILCYFRMSDLLLNSKLEEQQARHLLITLAILRAGDCVDFLRPCASFLADTIHERVQLERTFKLAMTSTSASFASQSLAVHARAVRAPSAGTASRSSTRPTLFVPRTSLRYSCRHSADERAKDTSTVTSTSISCCCT